MKGNEPAFPHNVVERTYSSETGKVVSGGAWPESGLTKREWMATMILAGILARHGGGGWVCHAVEQADALIEELSKEQP